MKALNTKIVLSVVIPTLLVFGTLGALGVAQHRQQLAAQMELKSNTVIRLLKIISASSYQNFEYSTLDEIAGGKVIRDPEIAFIVFLDENRRPLTAAPAEVQCEERVPRHHEPRDSHADERSPRHGGAPGRYRPDPGAA